MMGSVIIAIAIKHASINVTDFLIGFIIEFSNSVMLIIYIYKKFIF